VKDVPTCAGAPSLIRKYNEGWPWSSSGIRERPREISPSTKVSFEEAATVFGDPLGRIVADSRHSAVEERLVLLGISKQRRLLAVMYIERADTVRIISARQATRPERRDHEEIPQ
jgi:hypothetical protein